MIASRARFASDWTLAQSEASAAKSDVWNIGSGSAGRKLIVEASR
jgi:hypothetical protein